MSSNQLSGGKRLLSDGSVATMHSVTVKDQQLPIVSSMNSLDDMLWLTKEEIRMGEWQGGNIIGSTISLNYSFYI